VPLPERVAVAALEIRPRGELASGLSWPRPSRLLNLALFVVVPVLLFCFVAAFYARDELPWDFAVWRDAGQAVLDGVSPYPPADPRLLAQSDKFAYPAWTAVVFAPLAALPIGLSKTLFLILSLAAAAAALRLLAVRDFRCYGAMLLAYPTFSAFTAGAIGPFLLLAAAAAWRFRSRLLALAGAVALGAMAKLLLWPLFVWLLATRRFRAAAVSLLLAAGVTLAGWAVIGFAGMREYPSLVTSLSDTQTWKAYSAAALATSFGAGTDLVHALTAVLTLVGIALIVILARRGDGDRRAFAVAIAVALLAAPVLWSHYLILLYVPIALVRPRLSALWLVPLVLWISPHFESLGSLWKISVVLATAGAVLAAAIGLRAGGAPKPAVS
jgi:alpha-1,2-mannosyltransferase